MSPWFEYIDMSLEAASRLDTEMLIDGEWVDGEDRTDVIHPYDR